MKIIKGLLLSISVLLFSGCATNEYVGFWCNYEEVGTIRIEMDTNYSNANQAEVEKVINNFDAVTSFDFIPKEEFSASGELYDTYLIYFADTSTIDESALALEGLAGIGNIYKESVKRDVELYEFVDRNDFTYQDAIGLEDSEKAEGKYKVIDDSIELERPTKTTSLYIESGYLCGDAECNIIFSKTDEYCEKIN